LGYPNSLKGNQVKYILILLSILLLSSPLFGEDKPCYVSVTSSDDFNQTLLSNISISVISQYLKNVKPFPSSGLSGKEHCIYEVTATLDGNKTFVTLQRNDLNSFGDASIFVTEKKLFSKVGMYCSSLLFY
jgi:hypothetical protein